MKRRAATPQQRHDPSPNHSADPPLRAAFTLIEILIVITIIGILMGIVFAVYTDSLTQARIAATRATIAQLDTHLLDRQQAFQRLEFRSQAQQFIRAYNAGGNPAPVSQLDPVNHLQLAELMVRKDRFRAAFPQRLEDLWGFDGMPGTPDDAPLWTIWKQKSGATDMMPRPATHLPATESSELLYLALTEGGSFGLPSLGLDEINPNHLQDTDGDGLMEVVDDWGNPLRFYNWPTRLIRPQGEYKDIDGNLLRATAGLVFPNVTSPASTIPLWLYGNPLNQDPDDPTGVLSLWRDGEDLNNNNMLDAPPVGPPPLGENLNGDDPITMQPEIDPRDRTTGMRIRFFQQNFQLGSTTAQPLNENYYHTLNTYHVPLIVSAGPDGHTGLYEPDGRNPHNPMTPTTADFPHRLAEPLATSAGDPEVDELTDNVTNRRR